MARISYLRTLEGILNTLLVCFVRLDFLPVNSLFQTVSKQPLRVSGVLPSQFCLVPINE